MTTIDLKAYGITHTEFIQWIEESGAEVYAYIHHGPAAGASAAYEFVREEDLLAFELKFKKQISTLINNYTWKYSENFYWIK